MSKAPNFGLMAELSKVEGQARREIQSARHAIHTAKALMEDPADFETPEGRDHIRALLAHAIEHLDNLTGG